jgi:hypothetical protein
MNEKKRPYQEKTNTSLYTFYVLDGFSLFVEFILKMCLPIRMYIYIYRYCSPRSATASYVLYITCTGGIIVTGIRSGCAPNVKLNFNFEGRAREKSFELFDKEHLPGGFRRQINNKLTDERRPPLSYK